MTVDLAIRGGGVALLGMAALAVRLLTHAADTFGTALLFILCATAFLGVSFGAALVALGAHLLDEVELSGRWAPPYRQGNRSSSPAPDANADLTENHVVRRTG